MTAADIMSTDVTTVSPGTEFGELARLLRQKRVSALPVVDARRRPLGIVSEADLLVKSEKRPDGTYLFGSGDADDAAKAAALVAADAMTSPVVTVHPGVPVADIARKMLTHKLRRLPVVDDRGVMIGIISRRDLLKVFVRSDQELSSVVRNLLEDAAARFGVQDLRVKALSGVITLEGHVTERTEAEAIDHIARGVDGVVDVRNRLRVRTR